MFRVGKIYWQISHSKPPPLHSNHHASVLPPPPSLPPILLSTIKYHLGILFPFEACNSFPFSSSLSRSFQLRIEWTRRTKWTGVYSMRMFCCTAFFDWLEYCYAWQGNGREEQRDCWYRGNQSRAEKKKSFWLEVSKKIKRDLGPASGKAQITRVLQSIYLHGDIHPQTNLVNHNVTRNSILGAEKNFKYLLPFFSLYPKINECMQVQAHD